MSDHKRTVLITGCSEGGVGAELAKEFHKAGLQVYATARDPSKMGTLTLLGIEALPLDIQSNSSIDECAKKISHLDILINNAGASYTMPIADISISEAKKLFDINVWGYIAVTQAFLPLLIKSPKAMIVNHTSSGATISIPWQAVYNASKAAMSSFSNTLRMELEPFRISVVELRTGGVKTNIVSNVQAKQPKLPSGSIYLPARDIVEKALLLEWVEGRGITAEQWAKKVVGDLLMNSPSPVIWRGESAWIASVMSLLPFRLDWLFKKWTSLDKVESIIRKQ